MINPMSQNENTKNKFSHLIKELETGKFMRKSNITKNCGISAFEIFQFLLLLVFQGKNLFCFLNSKHKDQAVSKNTYYHFLNETSYNWKKFLLLLAAKVTTAFDHLTRPERVKTFVLDDSVVTRNRSKKVELLAKIYDHAGHRFKHGFPMLTLGWTDGYSFISVVFNMLSSSNKANKYQEIAANIGQRTNSYKFRKDSMLSKPAATIKLINDALNAGLAADYVIMDTWFTTEPMVQSVLKLGLDVIGMVKQLKQRYCFNGKEYSLPELQKFVRYNGTSNIFGSLYVTTKNGISVKIVFVRNRNKKRECLYILSTDTMLSDPETVRIYGNRWSIECFFKTSKSLLKLGSEFQCRSYSAMVSHTTIVFVCYILLEWIRRNENDERSYGGLFFVFCDDIQDMDLTNALQSLMALFVNITQTFSATITDMIKNQVCNWIASQARFIQAMFSDLCWES